KDIGDNDLSKYLVIGDSLSSDILGGIDAGIDTLWVSARGNPVSDKILPTYTANSFEELKNML
ncbi:MAG: HAD hydrolase-like protein, partial [Oscillospiraceae bacterium]|nr:HAD hydrolase-like protein [Candidatus Equicaccousia limihippi]